MCLSLRARQVYPHSDRLVDHQKRWLILKLLDDDFLASVMTNQKYEVNSKSALRGR